MPIQRLSDAERDALDNFGSPETEIPAPQANRPSTSLGGDFDYKPKRLSDEETKALDEHVGGLWQTPEYRAAMQAGSTAMSALGTLAKPITSFLDIPDKIVGRPLRSLIVEGPEAALKQTQVTALGDDNVPASPSWAEVAQKFGVSGEKTIEWPLYETPFEKYKASPADLTGAALGAVADPTMYIPGKKAVDLAADVAGAGATVAGKAMERGVVKGGRFLADMPEAKMERYFQRPKEIKAAASQTPQEFQNEIMGYVDNITKSSSDAVEKAKFDIPAILESTKQRRGKIAEDSLNILDEIPGSANKSEILKSFDNALASLQKEAIPELKQLAPTPTEQLYGEPGRTIEIARKVVIGDTQKQAYSKLKRIRNDVAQLPEPLTWGTLKGVLRDISPEINWKKNYGEINPVYDRLAKGLYSDMNKQIYEAASQNPHTAKYVEMQQYIKNLSLAVDDATKFFGTQDRVTRSLDAIRKDSATGKIAAGRLESLMTQLGKPNYFAELRSASAKEQGVKGISPRNVEGLVKRQLGDVPRDYEAGKLQYAQQFGGGQNQPPIIDRLKDFGVAEEFGKRGVVTGMKPTVGTAVGGAIGTLFGSPAAGAAVGAGIGMGMGYFGKKVMQVLADSAMGAEAGLRYLGGEKALRAISRVAESDTKSGKLLRAALAAGPKALIARHHLMMNTDPEYRESILGEENQP